MCEAVVPDVNPLKVTSTVIIFPFSVITAFPVPLEGGTVLGISSVPVRLAVKTVSA
jgi:hypothetical protein